MDNICEKEDSGSYRYIVNKFGEEKISTGFDWVERQLGEFLRQKAYEKDVIISIDILKHVIIDYFVDIDRLKEFQEIENIHTSKIYAYLSYWLLRHKPLQITKSENAGHLAFANEEFVCYLLRSYLFSDPENVPILENKREQVDNFVDTMLYFFQYREYSAQNIEIMILAFQAGCGYQYSVDHQ
ncbi:MAG: hypothetical protein SO130_06725 [Agathobacter sp.]|nr:hypothetical protein [Agathobacter sp.]